MSAKISGALSAGSVVAYHFEEGSSNYSRSYYSEDGKATGVWCGKQCEALGLVVGKPVDLEHFKRLAYGQDPHTGAQLIAWRNQPEARPGGVREQANSPMEHRAGWDITFSAPKGYSLTALVGGDERLVRIHDEGVKLGMAYFERAIQVKMGGIQPPETTAKLVAALFRHDTARPVDGYAAPQLHTHGVFFNMSQDSDGQFRAVNPTELFRLQGAADAVYLSHISNGARACGYETEQRSNHAFEIKGYTAEYLQAESQRRGQILAEQERIGQHGPQAGNFAALNTRDRKLDATPEEIRTSHIEHGKQYGDQAAVVVEQATHQHNRVLDPEERGREADRAVQYAKDRLSERTAVMEWHEIDRDALRLAKGNLTLEDVEAAKERAIGRGEFTAVDHWRGYAPGTRYTTPELQAKEHKILTWMQEGKGATVAIAGGTSRDELEKFTQLNDGQKSLVWNLIHSQDRMVGVQGIAGTGKSTALGVLRNFAEEYGFEVRGVAATGRAAHNLSDHGITSNTLAGFLLEKDDKRLPARLYVLDEASLADVHQMSDFLDKVNGPDRVVVIGDIQQHGSVGAGRVFAELQDAGMATFRLSEIVRQQPEEYRKVVAQLSYGEITAAMDSLREQGRIHECSDERVRHKAFAARFTEHPYESLGVAPDNAARLALTEEIRQAMAERGYLGDITFRTRILEQRSEMQVADRKQAINYNPGDVLVYSVKGGRFERGDRATVMTIDVDRNRLTVMRERDGKLIEYDPSRVGTSAGVYESDCREFAKGDRIQFTKNDKKAGVNNRQLGTIVWLDTAGNAVISLDQKEKQWIGNLEEMPHIDHGYVMTSYSSQSATVDRVLAHYDTDAPGTSRMLTRQLAYVSLSRGSMECHVYTNDGEELANALQRVETAPMALAPEVISQYKEKGQEVHR